MKFLLPILLLFTLPRLRSAELEWKTVFAEAQAEAKKSGRPILMNFTGSDWCVKCKQLDKAVFHTPAFADYARRQLVLFVADFPMEGKQPGQIAEQNEDLGKKYKVREMPTLLVVDAEGALLLSLKYEAGMDTAAFLAPLEVWRKQRTASSENSP